LVFNICVVDVAWRSPSLHDRRISVVTVTPNGLLAHKTAENVEKSNRILGFVVFNQCRLTVVEECVLTEMRKQTNMVKRTCSNAVLELT